MPRPLGQRLCMFRLASAALSVLHSPSKTGRLWNNPAMSLLNSLLCILMSYQNNLIATFAQWKLTVVNSRKTPIFLQQLIDSGFGQFDQRCQQMKGTIASLFTTSDHAGVLYAHSLAQSQPTWVCWEDSDIGYMFCTWIKTQTGMEN